MYVYICMCIYVCVYTVCMCIYRLIATLEGENILAEHQTRKMDFHDEE